MPEPIRINKYVRDQGLASRREADDLIAAGKVYLNGQRAQLGDLVAAGDEVKVKGGGSTTHAYLAYYKPRGLATQTDADQPSVIMEWQKQGLFPVGRLDKESEGLIILTNDGRLTTQLVGEGSQIEKEYLVTVRERLRPGLEKIFAKGMETKTFGRLKPATCSLKDGQTLQVILREGKRHQLRVMLSELGYTVNTLKRVRIGKISLGQLKPGETHSIKSEEF